MLCPECKLGGPGDAVCPRCGAHIPEQESFAGQGGYYLGVLTAISAAFFGAFVLVLGLQIGFVSAFALIFRIGENAISPVLPVTFFAPIVVGLYFWILLREEEIVVTDTYIARRSHWGDERLLWSDATQFLRRPILYRQTRLGRISALSRYFGNEKPLLQLPPSCWEIVGPTEGVEQPTTMRLEPGTIGDMPWLLELIKERMGPPQDA